MAKAKNLPKKATKKPAGKGHLSNFGGKQAPPFGKGGKVDKLTPSDTADMPKMAPNKGMTKMMPAKGATANPMLTVPKGGKVVRLPGNTPAVMAGGSQLVTPVTHIPKGHGNSNFGTRMAAARAAKKKGK
jgi:hypothetical protein